VRVNSSGDLLWSRPYGGNDDDECNAILSLGDGFLLAGTSRSFGNGGEDFWVIRTDATGDSLWSRSFRGNNAEQCWSVLQATNDEFLLTGFTQSYGAGQRDGWLVRMNSVGDSLWSQTYGGPQDDVCYSVAQAHDGGYVLAGYSESFGSGSHDFWLVKTDSWGDIEWSRTYGGPDNETCRQVHALGDGGYLLVGSTNSYGAGGNDIWIVRTNANGDSLWSRTFGGSSSDLCRSALLHSDNRFVLGGYTSSFGAGSNDFYLVQTGPDPSVDADDGFSPLPASVSLTAYPNPFNPITTLRFTLAESAEIRLVVFDVRGRVVRDVAAGRFPAGDYQREFNGFDLPSGNYFAHLTGNNIVRTQRLVLLK
jgi:hypothetical protein